jgi:transposase
MSLIGIDVSNDVIDATLKHGNTVLRRQFTNAPGGHRALCRWVLRRCHHARACLEATGIYHLQLALALDQHPDFEVMVVNPCAARRFAQAHMVRAKTDAIDADGLLLFLQRMPFHPWNAPRESVLLLQSLAHRMSQLNKEIVRERSRLHAAHRAGPHTRLVQQDIRAHIKQLQRRLETMKHHAWDVISNDQQLGDTAARIDSIPGFAHLSAIRLLAELAVLADDMTPQQWVAHAGLDPRPLESGSSQRPPRRISKQGNARIRSALFMPTLVAIQHEPHVAAYYQRMLIRGKPKMVAITAVMRRLLHALWGMQHHQQPWDGNKFYPLKAA